MLLVFSHFIEGSSIEDQFIEMSTIPPRGHVYSNHIIKCKRGYCVRSFVRAYRPSYYVSVLVCAARDILNDFQWEEHCRGKEHWKSRSPKIKIARKLCFGTCLGHELLRSFLCVGLQTLIVRVGPGVCGPRFFKDLRLEEHRCEKTA